MYRIIILLSLIHVVIPHWDCNKHSCHRRRHLDYRLRHRDRTFEHLAKQVINLDKKTGELCVENSNNRTTEDYGSNEYKITVNLPEYNEEDITVKHKYRALYINAEKKEDSDVPIYFEVRIVPIVADLRNASWDFTDGKLEISYSYIEKAKFTPTCEFVIDEEVRIVPKYTPKLDVRMEPETLESSKVSEPKKIEEDSDGDENKVNYDLK